MNTRVVQQSFYDIGWPIAVDGGFGPITRRAVTDFQRGFSFWNLLVDGYAGPQTWNAIQHALREGGLAGPHFNFREFKCTHCTWIKVRSGGG